MICISELRSEIDTLRMERGRFDLIYRKIDQTLTKMRNEINRLTALTTQAYNQRLIHFLMKICTISYLSEQMQARV